MRKNSFFIGTLILTIWCLFVLYPLATAQPGTKLTVVTGVRLIDGTGKPPMENVSLLLEADKIRAVLKSGEQSYPRGARIVEARRKTVMPALINAHGHLGIVSGTTTAATNYSEENVQRQLKQYEAYGVDTVMSLGTDQDPIFPLRDKQQQGTAVGARVLTAGQGFGVAGAVPPLAQGTNEVYRPTSVQQARTQVRELAAKRPDMLKLWIDDSFDTVPKMKPEIYQTIIDEAHRRKLRVAAHVYELADAKALVQAGVDVVAHSVRDRPVDRELISMMLKKNVFYIPTLTLDESRYIYGEEEKPAWMEDPFFTAALEPGVIEMVQSSDYGSKIRNDPNLPKWKAAVAMAQRNLKTLHAAGVKIGFGTDSGAQPTRVQGFGEHHELEYMVMAGLTPMQAIVSATRDSAQLLRIASIGTIEAGKQADFLVLDGNPLDDIRNTTKLFAVWHAGRQIDPIVPSAT